MENNLDLKIEHHSLYSVTMGFLSFLPFAWGLMWLIRLIIFLLLLGLLYEFLIGHYLVLHWDMNTVLRHLQWWCLWYGGSWSSKGVLQGLSARFLVPAFTWEGPAFWDNKDWKSYTARAGLRRKPWWWFDYQMPHSRAGTNAGLKIFTSTVTLMVRGKF